MSNTITLQVRANPKIVNRAKKKASSLGYSSLQEIIRVFLQSFAAGKVVPGIVSTQMREQFPSEHIKLGPKAEKRWTKILKEANEGKNIYSFDDPDKALSFLLSEER